MAAVAFISGCAIAKLTIKNLTKIPKKSPSNLKESRSKNPEESQKKNPDRICKEWADELPRESSLVSCAYDRKFIERWLDPAAGKNPSGFLQGSMNPEKSWNK